MSKLPGNKKLKHFKQKSMKVRHSKGLYIKKGITFKKVIQSLLILILIGGLGFVGYTAGKAILNYTPPEEPPETASPEMTGDITNPNPVDTEAPLNSSDSNDPVDPENKGDENSNNGYVSGFSLGSVDSVGGNAVYAPPAVLSSVASLSTYLNNAKSENASAVVFEMKSDEGLILYKSEIQSIAGDGDIIVGTLSAKQIADAAKAAGVVPIAKINTLKDHKATEKLSGVSYHGWLDDRPGIGKRWANPFAPETANYMSEIVGELYKAGFSEVVLTNTIFPNFRGIDFEILSSEITNTETRFNALGSFVNSVCDNNKGAAIFNEVPLNSIMGDVPFGEGEIIRCGNTLNSDGVVLSFSAVDFTASDVNAPASSIKSIVKSGLSKAVSIDKDIKIVPLVDRSGLSKENVDEIIKAFNENGYKGYIVRN